MVTFEQAANGVLQMLSLCGVCDTRQAAMVYTGRKRPEKAIRDVLNHLTDAGYIEAYRYAYNSPSAYRLTQAACREYSLKRVSWNTLLAHKLAVTDLYIALGCPRQFVREYRQEFAHNATERFIRPDARARLPDGRYGLFEVQRTPKTTKYWKRRLDAYRLYFASGAWSSFTDVQPVLGIVSLHQQQVSTIGAGTGYELRVMYTWEEVTAWACGLCSENRQGSR